MFILWRERPSCGILIGEESHIPCVRLDLEEWKEDFPKPTLNLKAWEEKDYVK